MSKPEMRTELSGFSFAEKLAEVARLAPNAEMSANIRLLAERIKKYCEISADQKELFILKLLEQSPHSLPELIAETSFDRSDILRIIEKLEKEKKVIQYTFSPTGIGRPSAFYSLID